MSVSHGSMKPKFGEKKHGQRERITMQPVIESDEIDSSQEKIEISLDENRVINFNSGISKISKSSPQISEKDGFFDVFKE